MAKKNLNPLEDPPTASSSDEEDEVETLSGDDEQEVEEQISDDSSSEEEEDDLTNPFLPATKPKPPPAAVTIPERRSLPAVIPGKKRPSEKTETSAKRAKTVSEESEKKTVEETTKRPLFQRLWSEEDEITLLQGMIDFKADTGDSPYEDMDRFYEQTRKAISFGPSKVQFVDKIRFLRKKYMKKVKEGVESLSKPHDMECLKLSKHIWGAHGMALTSDVKKSTKKIDSVKPQGKEVEEGEEDVALESAAKSNVKKSRKKLDSVKPQGKEVEEDVVLESAAKSNRIPKKSVKKPISVEANGDNVEEDRDVLVNGEKVDKAREVLVNGKSAEEDKQALVNGGDSKSLCVMRGSEWFEDSFLVRSIASLGVSEKFVRQKWSMVSVETKKRMEEKWKLLQDKEMELVLQKTDFMREVGSVIAEAS